jgi:hypothetical protein
MAPTPVTELQKDNAHARAKSRVRIYVTYGVTCVYLLLAAFVVVYLIINCTEQNRYLDIALGIFAGVASSALSIIGYWFGSRGQGFTTPQGAEPLSTAEAESRILDASGRRSRPAGGGAGKPTDNPPKPHGAAAGHASPDGERR